MRKTVFLFILALAFIPAVFGCTTKEAVTPLSQTVSAAENSFTFLVPENWQAKEAEDSDGLVLTMTDNISAYAHVYYYRFDEDYAELDDFLSVYQNRFFDDMIGEVETIDINEKNAVRFEYLNDDINEYFESAGFRGYIYLIEAPLGIICIDIYHTAVDPSKADEVSTEQQRLLLQEIAQSIIISDEE